MGHKHIRVLEKEDIERMSMPNAVIEIDLDNGDMLELSIRGF